MDFLVYLFWPNPGNATYGSPKAVILLVVALLLVVASVGIRVWRDKQRNPVTKKLSKSWASAALWFGLTAGLLVVSRVEGVQYIAMRFWWLVWGLSAAFYLFLQIKKFRARHYEVLPTEVVDDPRSKYLPRKKHR
jgi:ABC-type uncharacterized transport system fused permease/ATPase subunit